MTRTKDVALPLLQYRSVVCAHDGHVRKVTYIGGARVTCVGVNLRSAGSVCSAAAAAADSEQ